MIGANPDQHANSKHHNNHNYPNPGIPSFFGGRCCSRCCFCWSLLLRSWRWSCFLSWWWCGIRVCCGCCSCCSAGSRCLRVDLKKSDVAFWLVLKNKSLVESPEELKRITKRMKRSHFGRPSPSFPLCLPSLYLIEAVCGSRWKTSRCLPSRFPTPFLIFHVSGLGMAFPLGAQEIFFVSKFLCCFLLNSIVKLLGAKYISRLNSVLSPAFVWSKPVSCSPTKMNILK